MAALFRPGHVPGASLVMEKRRRMRSSDERGRAWPGALALAVAASVGAASVAFAQQAPVDRLPSAVLDVTPPSGRVNGDPGRMTIRRAPCRNLPLADVRRRIVDIAVQGVGLLRVLGGRPDETRRGGPRGAALSTPLAAADPHGSRAGRRFDRRVLGGHAARRLDRRRAEQGLERSARHRGQVAISVVGGFRLVGDVRRRTRQRQPVSAGRGAPRVHRPGHSCARG